MTPSPLILVFPADALSPSRVDDAFAEQADACRAAGFNVVVLAEDHRRLITRGVDVTGATLLYRGWMMTPAAYAGVVALFTSSGAVAFTSPSAYRAAHHIDGWVETIGDFTPETRLFPADVDAGAAFTSTSWPQAFLKDYVKSLKTSRGSVASSAEEARAIVDELRRYRGEIEGGLALRRVERFVTDSEVRHFVIDGVGHAPDGGAVSEIVVEASRRFTASRFISVDVVRRDDGVERIVEIGDGQVSDLVGWGVDAFVALFGTVDRG